MQYVDQLSMIVVFISHALSIQMRDTSHTKDQQNNQSIPLEIYLGYSHDPLGESHLIKSANETSRTNQYPNRSKRGALQLYNMVVCATGCNPLVYKGYGCYCGFLGAGYPVDSIDRCCRMHDWCYDTANCPMFLEYFVPYVWTCYYGQPLCASGWSCSHRLCECDRKLAECLRTQPCPRRKAMCHSSWRLFQNWRGWQNYITHSHNTAQRLTCKYAAEMVGPSAQQWYENSDLVSSYVDADGMRFLTYAKRIRIFLMLHYLVYFYFIYVFILCHYDIMMYRFLFF